MLNKNNILFKNIISLFAIKGLEYFVGFITFPYLVYTLGTTYYGKIVYAQTIISYILVFVEYGFNITGPKIIARCGDNKKKLAKIFMSILLAKIILLFLVFFIIVLFFYLVEEIDKILYMAVFLNVIGCVIFPIWFFQGIQRMSYITIVNVVARIITTSAIFILIKDESDYILAAILLSITQLIAGSMSYIFLIKQYKFLFVRVNKKEIWLQIKKGWQIFLATLASNIYSNSAVLVLGLFASDKIVGFYIAGKKVIDVVIGGLNPVLQAIYPYINNKIVASKYEAIDFIKKCVILLCGSTFFISLIIFILSDEIINIIVGNYCIEAIIVLKILSFYPMLLSISNMIGNQILIPFGYEKILSKIVLKGVLINIIIILPMSYFYQTVGSACTVIITELYISMTLVYKLIKIGIMNKVNFDKD